MRQLKAFIGKEFLELIRSYKLMICGFVFLGLGIMNPLIAKITPELMKMLAEDYKEFGFGSIEVKVTALTSWEQFFKNVPIGLIMLVLMFGGIVATELQRGSLINMVTKGLDRWKIMMAKLLVLLLLWTGCYYMSFGVTYGYNDYFWDNSIANHIGYSAFLTYIFGVWVISLMILFSSLCDNSAGVTIGTGAVFFISYLLGMVKKIEEYLPTKLMSSSRMPFGEFKPEDFTYSLIIVGVLILVNCIAGIMMFNKKSL